MSRIGKRGFSQIDKQVVSEGKRAAEKVKKEAERFNATLDLNLDTKDSFLLLRNPKKEYDAEYTIARTAVLLLALTNQVLSALGKPVLPIESAQLEQLVSVGITTVASLVAWWKNNSFTQEALAADVEYERQRKLNGK